jgi:hypothetical protein
VRGPDTLSMNNPLRSIAKTRRVAAVALGLALVPAVATTANAAPRFQHAKHATSAPAATTAATTTAATTTTSTATTSAPAVTSVIAIGGYVFYNVSYLEAVELWQAAVAAAPAGYTPPPVTSISVDTTVSGTVPGGDN